MTSHRPILKLLATLVASATVGAVLYGGAGALVGMGLVIAYVTTRRAAQWFGGELDSDGDEERSDLRKGCADAKR